MRQAGLSLRRTDGTYSYSPPHRWHPQVLLLLWKWNPTRSKTRISGALPKSKILLLWVIKWSCHDLATISRLASSRRDCGQPYRLTRHFSATLRYPHKNVFFRVRRDKRLLGIEVTQIRTQLASNGTQQAKKRNTAGIGVKVSKK